jgi:hypothetical protein
VLEVFWNLKEIFAHHQRMLQSLFSRQRDQHPIVQSVADIVLDSTFVFWEHAPSSLTFPNIRCTPVYT